jgi:G patch domain-containing protein 1
LDTKGLTEWERENEKEEFKNKYEEQVKKLNEMKREVSSRFASAAILNEQNQELSTTVDTQMFLANKQDTSEKKLDDKSYELEKAVKEKKFGKLTRTDYEWRPHPIVCMRFNVPNPYPE